MLSDPIDSYCVPLTTNTYEVGNPMPYFGYQGQLNKSSTRIIKEQILNDGSQYIVREIHHQFALLILVVVVVVLLLLLPFGCCGTLIPSSVVIVIVIIIDDIGILRRWIILLLVDRCMEGEEGLVDRRDTIE